MGLTALPLVNQTQGNFPLLFVQLNSSTFEVNEIASQIAKTVEREAQIPGLKCIKLIHY